MLCMRHVIGLPCILNQGNVGYAQPGVEFLCMTSTRLDIAFYTTGSTSADEECLVAGEANR
jgi:hypothetical protein